MKKTPQQLSTVHYQRSTIYAPLWCKSVYSFLEGASHPDELVEEAHRLGIRSLALTDRDGVYEYDEGARAPDVLPAGIESDLEDPELVACLESLLEGDLDFDEDDYDGEGDEDPLDFDD